ncbi:MAG: YqeG family HAD IIIA-type phosphatase [Clostridia bacterium]|nr:YqeG family HAD IIIA-type phosphatase [Clostridia bacterium]
MAKSLVPDHVFDTFSDITVEFLKKQNIHALLCDVDNTLSPYEHDVPNDNVCAWIKKMNEGGIKIALVSNNNYERLNKYNEKLQLVAYADAGKPSRKCYYKAAADLSIDIKDCAVLGDQLLTDCWSARRLGIPCFIVPPINDKRDLFHRFKRAIEVPFMKAYQKRHKA